MYKSGFFTFQILTITILTIALTSDLLAAGINTDVALPVREGGFVFRSQIRWLKATDDPTPVSREVNIVAIPNVLVYGATPDLSLFAIVPYIFSKVELTETSSGKRIDKDDNGIGDTTLPCNSGLKRQSGGDGLRPFSRL